MFKHCTACACGECQSVSLLQRRFSMPRRGWKSMEVPTGWVQVIRGPRAAFSGNGPWHKPVQRPRQPWVSPVPASPRAPTVRVSPGGNCEAAHLKVVKFQQALAVLGDTDGVAVECLKAELEKAKKGLPETPARYRDRRVPEVHRQV